MSKTTTLGVSTLTYSGLFLEVVHDLYESTSPPCIFIPAVTFWRPPDEY